VLPRLAPTATSELAALWSEGADGGRFSAALDDLRARLEAAAQGPRAVPKLEAGDVVALPGETGAVLVQVLSAREAAVFAGTAPSDEEVAARVAAGAARRVACDVARVLRRARALGRHPVRKDLRGRKLYASEAGPIEEYMLSQASGAGMRDAPYDEARRHDTLEPHSEAMLLSGRPGRRPGRVGALARRAGDGAARDAPRRPGRCAGRSRPRVPSATSSSSPASSAGWRTTAWPTR
jgi:hypothetical protein